MTAYSPDQALWQSVLLKALIDATQPNPTQSHDIAAKRQAHHWITDNSRDFRLVCVYAGFDPGTVRRRYIEKQICPLALRRVDVGRRSNA